MSIQFPDLQVLMPRADEISRTLPAAHQQEMHQQALAAAAQVEAGRQRRRITKARAGENTARPSGQWTARTRQDEEQAKPPRPDGLGRRVDVRV